MKPNEIQGNLGLASISFGIGHADPHLYYGNLYPWFFIRALPVEKFDSYEKLFEQDARLFLNYMEGRAKLFDVRSSDPVSPPDRLRIHAEIDHQINSVEYLLEIFNRYSKGPMGKKDQAEFEKIVAKRLQDWEALHLRDKPPDENPDAEPPEPDTREIVEEVKKQREYHRSVTITEDLPEAAIDEVLAENNPLPEQNLQPGVKHLLFPPFMILKKAFDQQREMRNKIIELHDLTLSALKEAEANILEVEKSVRAYDNEKAPYVYRKERIPDELMERLIKANNEVLKAKKARDEAAGAYYGVHKLAIGFLELKAQRVSTIRPKAQGDTSCYRDVDKNELAAAVKDYRRAFVEREAFKNTLISILIENPLEFKSVEDAVTKIRANDFNGLKDILPEELEAIVPGEVGIIEIWKMVDKITAQHEIVVRTGEVIAGANPTQLIQCRLECCQGLSHEIQRFENNLQLYIANKEEKPKKKVINELKEKITHLGFQRKYESSCYYREVVEGTIPDAQEYLHERNRLSVLAGEIMQKEGVNLPEAALLEILRGNYKEIRRYGEPIPQCSMLGVAHDPVKTIEFAKKSRAGIEALPAEEDDGWQYRAPNNFVSNLSLDQTEGHDRISCRLVASPQAIKALDELAKKFKFAYKIPYEDKYWRRADTVTLYFIDLPDEAGQKEIAESLQKFVFEGDDNNLLGKVILDDKSVPFRGVRTNHGTTLFEIADMIKCAYEISSSLGNAMTEYYGIKDIDDRIEFSGSPGMVEAGRELLRDLSSK